MYCIRAVYGIPPSGGAYAYAMASKEDRARDNSFLDRERRRWLAPVLLGLLAIAATVLVVIALTR